jgi:hypothetical protein
VELRYRRTWWDSLIVGAAQLQGCTVLLTEDLQDGGVFGGVAVRSPFTLAIEEAVAVYAAAPRAARPHPSRGRPKGGRSSRASATS